MIETHCQPNKALSDANQQINPQELKKLKGKFTNTLFLFLNTILYKEDLIY